MVVVFPMPLAPITNRIVGIFDSFEANRIADAPVIELGSVDPSSWVSLSSPELSSLVASTSLSSLVSKSSVSISTPRITLIKSSRDKSSGSLPSSLLLASDRDLTSLTMSSDVATPKSACNKTSCKSSKSSSKEVAAEAPNKPSRLPKNRLRDLAKPAANASLVTCVYSAASANPCPMFPFDAASVNFESCSIPSLDRCLKKSKTIDSSVVVVLR
mmetsp:Transcript_17103/g.35124  ORF Transcript_17103/g.35124 Transcript_17103/m.35124 type:complete len:215 (+) Transcript_17103:1039-1683(+)